MHDVLAIVRVCWFSAVYRFVVSGSRKFVAISIRPPSLLLSLVLYFIFSFVGLLQTCTRSLLRFQRRLYNTFFSCPVFLVVVLSVIVMDQFVSLSNGVRFP